MPRIRGSVALDGAVLKVEVSVGVTESRHLWEAGQPVPPPFITA